ncbi:oxygen-insensitive NADPH nitroreductase [Bacillus sp. PS06]|uniref:oxygen-insensitive NADPH nitroreductase n=1 Tax=Bacillus sp. PS06 TaxID=2764176 RepID=UPI001782566D|nr:oxygen-insensitive NADPH nitroreductase [Bacillus sp. PS06]MBD8070363.1 oxygen-insensitive NADPH nitroreductase [Bacillus sp. PS06]
MNSTIETILNHRSIRKFTDEPLTEEQIQLIVESAQAASTSSFVQAYTIIGVKNHEKKKKLAELAGNQSYVENNGHFFVFCADLNRHEMAAELEGKDMPASLETTETFMVALIDAALASQNAVLAAESMGLGACYIGGIRNNLEEVQQVLKTPKRVLPLFGIAIGYPMQESSKKPRLPFSNIYHEDEYQQDTNLFKQQLEEYNQEISSYYHERTGGKRNDTWTAQMTNMMQAPKRTYMKDYINKQGLSLK